MAKTSNYLNFWKPTLDKSIAFVLLIVLFPISLSVSLMLLISGNKVFFGHVRPGFNGEPFKLLKFTTMRDGAVFPLGKFLRRSSLDELPQLWNVLVGEMSFIGPRPLLVEYMSTYTTEQLRRHQVKPGITGWAQVHGRKVLSLKDKVALDLHYVSHASLALDLKIILKSFRQIVKWNEADETTTN
ncbi:MAG: sugar transferase [Marinoscillum sp.]